MTEAEYQVANEDELRELTRLLQGRTALGRVGNEEVMEALRFIQANGYVLFKDDADA